MTRIFRDQIVEKQTELQPLLDLQLLTSNYGDVNDESVRKEAEEAAAAQPEKFELNLIKKERELRDIISKDIERTCQDVEFYALDETKQRMSDLLYLWAKDNPQFGYRQGMNEILAILVHAVFSEIVDDSGLKIDADGDLSKLTNA